MALLASGLSLAGSYNGVSLSTGTLDYSSNGVFPYVSAIITIEPANLQSYVENDTSIRVQLTYTQENGLVSTSQFLNINFQEPIAGSNVYTYNFYITNEQPPLNYYVGSYSKSENLSHVEASLSSTPSIYLMTGDIDYDALLSLGTYNASYKYKLYFTFYYLDQYAYDSINASENFEDYYDSGYTDGYSIGYQAGYGFGYSEGAVIDDQMSTIFAGILDIGLIPINFFLAILNFEVFGINLGAFVSATLTIAIIIIMFRVITGKKDD